MLLEALPQIVGRTGVGLTILKTPEHIHIPTLVVSNGTHGGIVHYSGSCYKYTERFVLFTVYTGWRHCPVPRDCSQKPVPLLAGGPSLAHQREGWKKEYVGMVPRGMMPIWTTEVFWSHTEHTSEGV